MLSLQALHDGQDHSFSNVSNSDERNFSKELLKLSVMGTDTMSSFSSLTAEQKQLLHVIVVLKVLESKSPVLNNAPFNSSKTTCKNSATSCWELKSNRALQLDGILGLSAHREFDGSIGTADFSLITIFSTIDFSNRNSSADSAEEALQSKGITLSACRIVLA